MSSDLRKSLESIQSLISQTMTSPMTAMDRQHSRNSNAIGSNGRNRYQYGEVIHGGDIVTLLHSPSLSTPAAAAGGPLLLSSPATPATQATLPSGMPGGSRYVPPAAAYSDTVIANASGNGGSVGERAGAFGGQSFSDASSSICNFSNTTPYQLKGSAAASSMAFTTGSEVGRGAVIVGSPLSAFSSVHRNSVGRGEIGGGGRETMMSLLVSPPTSRLDDYNDPAAAHSTAASSTIAFSRNYANETTAAAMSMTTTLLKEQGDDNDGVVANHNPNAKDPTPYQYRANPPAKCQRPSTASSSISSSAAAAAGSSGRSLQQQRPRRNYHNNSNQQQQQQREEYQSNANSSTSSSTTRSIDPPAKSPFGSIISAGGGGGYYRNHHQQYHHLQSSSLQQQQQQQQQQHSHPITELSIIEEDFENNNNNNDLNHSHTSTVTGFTATLPRTPILRQPNYHHHGANHHSGGSGSSSSSKTGGGGGNVAFATPGSNMTKSHAGGPYLSTEKLLRRPSAAMRDSFQQLASQTARQLEEVWDVVGIIPEERASQLAELVDRIATICHEKIDQEEQLANQFRKEIAEARAEWEECCEVLRIVEEDPLAKLKRDPSVTGGDGGVSLQSEYEVMMTRLESVRSVREEATGDIVSSQTRIYKAYAALHGCSVEVAQSSPELVSWADTTSNLTEEQRELFRSKALEYEESVVSRTQAVVSLLVDCQNLIRELEIVPPGCCDGKEDNANFDDHVDGYIKVGLNHDDLKIMKSLKSIDRSNNNDDDDDHARRPRSRGKSSDSYTVTSYFESSSCIGIGKDVLDRLTSRIAELNGEKRRRRNKLGEMGTAIASLWSLLRVPPDEQRAFTESIRGLGMDTLEKGEIELSRLHELKAVMIGKLIREQRRTIEELWESTNATDAEMASFYEYICVNDEDKLTDELLAKHEQYVGALNAKLEKMQPILDLIERREAIIEERVELDLLQKDPDRLKGRNASKQLLKEEKMMRRVQKELPKITEHLERKLKEWFEENKPSQTEGEVRDEDLGHFMYKGLPYMRTMKTQEHEWRTRKEKGEQERQRKRQEERSASSGSAFGSTYSKLPGKKWNPPIDRPRSASNMRPQESRGLRQGDMNRVNRPGEKSAKLGMEIKSSGYGVRAASAPRMRL